MALFMSSLKFFILVFSIFLFLPYSQAEEAIEKLNAKEVANLRATLNKSLKSGKKSSSELNEKGELRRTLNDTRMLLELLLKTLTITEKSEDFGLYAVSGKRVYHSKDTEGYLTALNDLTKFLDDSIVKLDKAIPKYWQVWEKPRKNIKQYSNLLRIIKISVEGLSEVNYQQRYIKIESLISYLEIKKIKQPKRINPKIQETPMHVISK